ncbi:hypothetical protein [Nostoc sp. T09]|nr:hypothetical protein [Nostoc sp. T09]
MGNAHHIRVLMGWALPTDAKKAGTPNDKQVMLVPLPSALTRPSLSAKI